jgi:hypothetical protein
MRKILLSLFALASFAVPAAAQTNLQALPAPTQHAINLTWTNACPSGVTCTFDAYRCAGAVAACPDVTVGGSAIWLKLNSTPVSGTAFQDSTVSQVGGTVYSYVVYADATVSGTAEMAGPSNEVAATIPLGPVAPAALTATAQ